MSPGVAEFVGLPPKKKKVKVTPDATMSATHATAAGAQLK